MKSEGLNPVKINGEFVASPVPIYFENEEIVLNSAPDYTKIKQVINKHIALDSKYRIIFNANITSGQIRVYYFNSDGHGFIIPVIDNTNSGYYDSIHTIGHDNSTMIPNSF